MEVRTHEPVEFSRPVDELSCIVGEEVKPRRKINATRMVAYKRRLKQQRMMAERTREEPTVSTRVYYAPNQPKEDTSWQM